MTVSRHGGALLLTIFYALCASAYFHVGNRNHNNFKFSSNRQRSIRLNSFGDPDLSWKSNAYRAFQEFARFWDYLIFPEEPDIPGVTFRSPVEWAPWMETIWFGNIYDYRAAYFHDVMYSNNQPCREGALLYKDAYRSLQMALLYQRYKRFDVSSYSLSNATFFNIFGGESMRVGRYKVPLTEEVILCTTDPLTSSEIKRYLNSLGPFKWFKSKFFQQKRKRQYVLRLSSRKDNKFSDYNIRQQSNFFRDAIYLIENGRLGMSNRAQETSITVPISPLSNEIADTIRIRRAEPPLTTITTLQIPLSSANSQYFLENLAQSVLSYLKIKGKISLKRSTILVGGDGRLLNDFAFEVISRVATGNNVHSVVFSSDAILATPTAIEYMLATQSASDSRASKIAFVLSAADSAGGLQGDFGMQVLIRESDCDSVTCLKGSEWLEVVQSMTNRLKVNIAGPRTLLTAQSSSSQSHALINPVSPSFYSTGLSLPKISDLNVALTRIDTVLDPHKFLLDSLRRKFNFEFIKAQIESRGIAISVDVMNAIGSMNTLLPVLKELGLDESSLLGNQPNYDFGGLTPAADVSKSLDSMALFSVPSYLAWTLSDLQSALLAVEEINYTVPTAFIKDSRSAEDLQSCPDVGFVFSSDGSECAVLGPGISIAPSECALILKSRVFDLAGASEEFLNGPHQLLCWLDLLTRTEVVGSSQEAPLKLTILQQELRCRHGVRLTMQANLRTDISTAEGVFVRFGDLQSAMEEEANVFLAAEGSNKSILNQVVETTSVDLSLEQATSSNEILENEDHADVDNVSDYDGDDDIGDNDDATLVNLLPMTVPLFDLVFVKISQPIIALNSTRSRMHTLLNTSVTLSFNQTKGILSDIRIVNPSAAVQLAAGSNFDDTESASNLTSNVGSITLAFSATVSINAQEITESFSPTDSIIEKQLKIDHLIAQHSTRLLHTLALTLKESDIKAIDFQAMTDKDAGLSIFPSLLECP